MLVETLEEEQKEWIEEIEGEGEGVFDISNFDFMPIGFEEEDTK